jgi:hypothetical protein
VATSRTFIVRVSESPLRVVIEDVRERRRAVAAELQAVAPQIASWLAATPDGETPDTPAAEDSARRP